MKRFAKYCLLFSLPMAILLICYILMDPFKVIWHYDSYYDPNDFVGINRGYASTMNYINHKDLYQYDSFIFGNSRSIAFHEEEWKKYLPESSVCYHFDESSGSVSGLYYKIQYICSHGHLKNALLVVDYQMLDVTEIKGHLFSLPPVLNNYRGVVDFHWENFSAFCDIQFLWACVNYALFKEYKPYMQFLILDPSMTYCYNPINNEMSYPDTEEKIKNGVYYDDEHTKVFENKQRGGFTAEVSINEERRNLLAAIGELFDLYDVDFKIVISPLYDQLKLHPSDLQVLYEIFGAENVFDFSGVNQWNMDYHNYYESSHYRPVVANEVMSIVYGGRS